MFERLRWRRRQERETASEPDAAAPGPLVREGQRVRLRQHVPANRGAFQRWYADPEIANLLRHDLEPLSASQSASYFDSLILPLSQRGLCYAIHETGTDRLIGTTALTDISRRTTGRGSALFRIVIGEKDVWNKGYGTEATRLVVAEGFETHELTEVRLEVFRHNPRAITAYQRVGFTVVGEHVEWVGRSRRELNVIEMRLRRSDWEQQSEAPAIDYTPVAVPDVTVAEDRESAADQAQRIARRRELQQQRRTRRTAREMPADAEPESDHSPA